MWYVVSAKKTNSQNTLTDLSTSCFKCAYERETEKWLWLCDDRLSTTNKIEHTNRAQSNIETNGGQFSIFQFENGQITRNSQIELKIAVTWSLSGSLSLSLVFSANCSKTNFKFHSVEFPIHISPRVIGFNGNGNCSQIG